MDARLFEKKQSEIQLKIRCIKHFYSFVKWDEIRKNTQFVSVLLDPVIAMRLATKMIDKTSDENKAAIVIFASRKEENKSRIIINLDKLSTPQLTRKEMLIITAFLNETHCPPEEIWNACKDKKIFARQWEIAADHLFLAGPSCSYTDTENGMTGQPIKSYLLKYFKSEKCRFTKKFNINFQKSLITENHTDVSYHKLEWDSFVCRDLLKIATHYHDKKMQPFIPPITYNALPLKIFDISAKIGSFLTSNDASKLAMTNSINTKNGRLLREAEKSVLTKSPGL